MSQSSTIVAMSDVLLVAATERELCGFEGLTCGVGPVEAAAAVARALAFAPPRALLHVGVAGGRGLAPGSMAIGSEAIYCDIAAAIPVCRAVAPDGRLVAAARRVLPGAVALPIGTSAVVGSVGRELAVEAMEGFAVLRAASLAGVPAVEVRAIANEIGEPERQRWRIEDALGALSLVLPTLVVAIEEAVPPSEGVDQHRDVELLGRRSLVDPA